MALIEPNVIFSYDSPGGEDHDVSQKWLKNIIIIIITIIDYLIFNTNVCFSVFKFYLCDWSVMIKWLIMLCRKCDVMTILCVIESLKKLADGQVLFFSIIKPGYCCNNYYVQS